MNKALITVLLVTMSLLGGCGRRHFGRALDRREVALIEPGHSNKNTVRDQFGRPLRVVTQEEIEIWVYRHMDGEGLHQDLIVTFNSDGKVVTFSSK